ncbi:MAG: transcription termination/antitermination protein NusA [Parcubacteria group bacterium]|nr:transcription termination/antitermination protein NusA [Parcubacteria group bacterium]
MLDLKTIASAILQIAEEKGIPKERVIETVEMALAAAYKKEYGQKGEIVRAKFNPDTGELKFVQVKVVVDESMLKEELPEGEEAADISKFRNVEAESPEDFEEKKIRFNPDRHIMLDEAKKIKKGILPGEELEFPLETREDFGRIAAQTAKQVILQRIHEAERETVFEEYKSKEGEVVSGIVQRMEGRNVFVDLGKAIGVVFPDETLPGERYHIGERLKFYVVAVEVATRGPSVFLSRSHPKLVSKLFAFEVPEIADGIVEIKSIAREPGSRTKIGVVSNDEAIDPIGACVGQKGTRVSAVIQELGGEKIDIIGWSDEPLKFISNALAPAKVIDVEMKPRHEARVFVPPDQLSLAIGKGGQNVRLAARLTGWKIEVRSSTKPEEQIEGAVAEAAGEEVKESVSPEGANLESLEGVGEKTAKALRGAGFDTIEKIAGASIEELKTIEGIGAKTAEKVKNQATKHVSRVSE